MLGTPPRSIRAVLIYLNHAIPYRRAIWHTCVILGAAGHYGAVLVGLIL